MSSRSGKDGAKRTRGQKYQNTFAYKHNKSSKRTQEILAVPIGGVCRRCYDVLTWRKAYRKYKPKTRPGKCNICAQKTVKQAYCSVCRPCAKAKGLCEKCGCKPAEGLVQREKTAEEERFEQQRMEYELKFMSERERRSTLRQRERENDKRLQRQLKFIARKEAEAAAAGESLGGRSGDADADEWSGEAQPTDLASQQRVLMTFYQEVEPTKTEADILGILDKRRGDSPVLVPDDWNLLCAKLKLKYGQHPLEVMAEHMDRMLELDSDSDGDDLDFDDSEFGDGESEYQDSLLDAMDELGWDTETEADTATDVADDDSGSDDFATPSSETGESLADKDGDDTTDHAETGGREMPAAFYDDAGVGPANVPVRENLGTDNPLSAAAPEQPSLTAEEKAAARGGGAGRGNTTYVVEHLEDDMGEWAKCEYMHMLDKLGGDASRLIITNIDENSAHWISDATTARGYNKGMVECDAKSISKRPLDPQKVCLLDMRGTQPLEPEDADIFTHFVLGGILGDDPPRDRTKVLRDMGFQLRHMNERQMATNTAMIVADMILSDGKRLEEIEFVEDITLNTAPQGDNSDVAETTHLPYRYLKCDSNIGVSGDDGGGGPLLAPGLLEHMRSDAAFF